MNRLTPSLLVLSVATAMLGPSPWAWADYPERPVRMFVGVGPGSSADVASRIVGEELSRTMGQRFFVENKPGASSKTAATTVSKSDADGYTLFLGSVANVIN